MGLGLGWVNSVFRSVVRMDQFGSLSSDRQTLHLRDNMRIKIVFDFEFVRPRPRMVGICAFTRLCAQQPGVARASGDRTVRLHEDVRMTILL